MHCKAHCLNLVLVEAAKSNKYFVTFVDLVEKLPKAPCCLSEMAAVSVPWTARGRGQEAVGHPMGYPIRESTEGPSENSESCYEAP